MQLVGILEQHLMLAIDFRMANAEFIFPLEQAHLFVGGRYMTQISSQSM